MRRFKIKRKNAARKQNRSALNDLPMEVKQGVASFLSTQELIYLVMSNKAMISDLDLTVNSSPFTDQASQNQVFQTCHTNQAFAAIIPKPEVRLHSMAFSCNVDQKGWSDGNIWIVEQELPASYSRNILRNTSFDAGKVVACASTNEKRQISLPFRIQKNKVYFVVINTQGFDDAQIHIENMKLHRVGYGPMLDEYSAFQYDVHLWVPTSFVRTFEVYHPRLA
eukprot:CAMPEP_0113651186 /NCGR_PEP_ID=MMETSP0017_2-20120614/27273_1 /TAXON_ID=2856 /ORGANISM="Cylindrotheca closterium" /LENGTH=222 /DNA_ID=CAMNT_0000563819 /DNA_START=1317 /DNA_END=1985 /DNA_ORIENTATION=- /assembly_acc=CAM_ASM_000147